MEQEKIKTVPKNFRLPEDVLEILREMAESTGQTETQVICTVMRVSAEDSKRVLQGVVETEDSVLQEGEIGASVLQLRRPKNRDELADAFSTLMYETADRIGERDRISALGVARARIYKLTPEYAARKEMMGEGFYSPYEDEKALAAQLSKTGGVDYSPKMREKEGK